VKAVPLALLVAASACKLDIAPGAAGYRCDDQHACPSDTTCVDGFCAVPEDAGGGNVGDDGGAPAAPCGKTTLLVDDFDADGPASYQWFVNVDARVDQQGGELVLTPEPDQIGSYPHYYSFVAYDLHESSITVELTQPVTQQHGVYSSLAAIASDDEQLSIVEEDGALSVGREDDGVTTYFMGPDYDPEQHRVWRLRDDGETMFAEVSRAGASWDELASFPSDPAFRYSHVMLEAGTYEAVASPGAAHYDNLDTGAPAGGVFCSLDSLADAFDDGVTSPAWTPDSYTSAGATMMEDEGLVIDLSPELESEGIYISSPVYDLRDGAISVHVAETTTKTGGAVTWLALHRYQQARKEVEVVQVGTLIELRVVTGDTRDTLASTTYDAIDHAWWRLADDGGDLTWSVSDDGLDWHDMRTFPNPLGAGPARVHLGASNFDGVAEPGRARFRQLNLPPP
jgi:hypothetical protein